MGAPKQAAHPGYARVRGGRYGRTETRASRHRPELEAPEVPASVTDSGGDVYGRPWAVELHRNGQRSDHRKSQYGAQKPEGPLEEIRHPQGHLTTEWVSR